MIRVLLLGLILLSSAVSQTSVSEAPRPDIVENNHFYSESKTQKVYTITKLQDNVPLAVVIKSPTTVSQNSPVTLTLSSGSNKKSCTFKNLNGLCVLDKVSSESGSLELSCSSTPCEVSWTIFQTPINKLESSTKVQELYEIPTGYKRMHISLSCNSQPVQNPQKLSLAFSSLDMQTTIVDDTLILSFPKPQIGFLLLKKNPEYKQCLTMGVKNVKDKIAKDLVSDMIKKGEKVAYPLESFPSGIFRFDMEFDPVTKVSVGQAGQSTISITGVANGQRITIRSSDINYPEGTKDFDVSFAVPKIDSSVYSDIQLEIYAQQSSTLVQFQLATDDHILVQPTERSIFELKKGQKLPYRLVANQHAEKGDKVNIFLSDKKALTSSKESCEFGKQCDFDIEATADVKGSVYLGSHEGNGIEVLILDFKDDMKFTKKVKQFSSTYIKKKVQLQKALKVVINTPNAIVYMATSTKDCGLPSKECYDVIGSFHKSFMFTPETKDDEQVIFMIKALDNCEFTLTLFEEKTEFLELEDSKPFSYELGPFQESMQFKFKRQKDTDVSFNLVAPLHSLDLIVNNQKKMTKDPSDSIVSAEGFIEFPFKQAKNEDFSIMVRKREGYQNKKIHFTIIASTTGKEVRLETSITHYETLSKNKQSTTEYVFQFDEKDDYVVNFYSHNNKNQQMDITMILTSLLKKEQVQPSKDEKKILTKEFTIDQSSDKIDLNTVSEQLCTQKGQSADNCQLFMILRNNMDIEVDIAITLMSRHAVIELKDGVWQGFDMNSIAKTAHFFFYPHNIKEDVTLFYKTEQQQVRIKYSLFYGDTQSLNPLQWPFPNEKITDQQSSQIAKFKPVNQVTISKKQFENCWPHCIVLISLVQLNQKYSSIQRISKFSIMASNSIMQIPEKEKIEITMKAEEEKMYLVDLKYALANQKDIYFNVFHTMGVVNLYASVYSERSARIPDEDEADFKILGHDEMKIPIQKIKQILEQQEMDEHFQIYLYILAQAISDSKLSIEFQFSEQDEEKVKMMSFDSFQHAKLPPKTSKLYYTSVQQPFEIKIQRTNGFPFYQTQICDKKLDQCIENFKDSDEKGTQLLTKVAALSQKSCKNCYQMLRISAEEDPAEAIIHLQSLTSQIELSESKTVYDFIEDKEQNRYMVFGMKSEETFINIDISEGEVEVEVTDLHKVHEKKSGSKVISFSIPPAEVEEKPKMPSLPKGKKFDDLTEEQKAQFKQQIQILRTAKSASLDAYALSGDFTIFYVTVRSTQSTPSIYSITYSSGERQFDLQDGLITQYFLDSDKEHVFYYSSKNAGHAYLTIASETSKNLQDLQITLKFCEPKEGIIDEDCWQEFPSTKPPIKDKTPNPSIMYSLPAKNYFAIFLESKSSKGARVSLGINHQEIMILPFDRQYPFALHQAQNINFLVQLSNPGYIEMVVRKCDESNPKFSYTYDYDGFQENEFTYETELNENPKSNFYSKVKPGTLYIRFESPNQQSLLSLQVHYSDKKIKDEAMKPGNNGDMTYSIIDSSTAQLSLHPPTCGKSSCPKNTKYVLMTTSKMRDLYTQLVCPSNFFSSYENFSIDPIKEQDVQPKTNSDGTISLTFTLSDQISYVGLKVVVDKKAGSEIYYRPIEVATLWGQLSRTSHSHKLSISTVFICSLLVVIVMVRRNARRGYKPIEDEV